jgi:enoyl-CoA hydratase/carnithine racemase
MEYAFIRYKVNDGIAYITINRPDVMNAVHPPLRKELGAAFGEFESDESARLAIMSGEGKAFCAGLDLRYRGEDGEDSFSDAAGALSPIVPERRITRPSRPSMDTCSVWGWS